MIATKRVHIGRMFPAKPSLGARFSLLLILSWLIWVGETHSPYVRYIRDGLSYVALPLQWTVDWPIANIGWALESLQYNQQLVEENRRLKSDMVILRNTIQQMTVSQSENEQLKALLDSYKEQKHIAAKLLAVQGDSLVQQMVFNKGKQDGVEPGQAVVDAFGLVGQVTRVTPRRSTVLSILDLKSAVPVQSLRTGIRGIIMGGGANGKLSLINMPSHIDIEPGDLFVTSGLGERYPYGYSVGKVLSVAREHGDGFAQIDLLPSARLERSRLVLLLATRMVK